MIAIEQELRRKLRVLHGSVKKFYGIVDDEFYTPYDVIEESLKDYAPYFKNSKIICPCDNPLKSNFYKYFADNFEKLGLKKITATCYRENKNGLFSDFLEGDESYKHGYFYSYEGGGNPSILLKKNLNYLMVMVIFFLKKFSI